MAFTKRHARENTAIFEAACLLVENDDYATAWQRYRSGELEDELARRFPDVTRKRLRQQAAKAVRRRPLSK